VRNLASHVRECRGFSRGLLRKPPHHEIRNTELLGKCLTILRAPHPSRLYTSQRMVTLEFLGSQRVLRRSNGLSGSSSLRQRRLVGRRSLARARSVVPSRQPAARSASTSRLSFRRMLRGPSRTNLAALGGSGSSGLINLLVFHLAASADSRCQSLLNQGPLRAGNAVPGPNYFLLSPTAFHHPTRLMESGGYTVRGLTAESGLFFSDLRAAAFLLFFAAIARLTGTLTSQRDSAIRRPNVSSLAKTTHDRIPRTHAPQLATCNTSPIPHWCWFPQRPLTFSPFRLGGFRLESLICDALFTCHSRSRLALLNFYSTPRRLENSATTAKQTVTIRSIQIFFAFSAHATDRARRQTLRMIQYFPCTLRLPASAVSAKVIGMASLIQEVGETFFTLYKGFSVTLRTMFRKTTTESFPDAPPTVQPRYRGIHVLQRDEHGYEKCVGCFLCAAACPANCIYIEAAENTAANRISAGERYAKTYNIDYSRCIFCGYCVEACPTDAITHGHSIELAPYNINALIYRKEQLLEPWPPRAKQ
jgi:NADH-quinone oxidoreductase subunit I